MAILFGGAITRKKKEVFYENETRPSQIFTNGSCASETSWSLKPLTVG